MESLISKIQRHLADVAQNPGVQLDQSLLGSFDRHLSGKCCLHLRESALPSLVKVFVGLCLSKGSNRAR